MKSWIEISENRLTENYKLLVRSAGGGTAVLAVVKANAYGHGAEICAPVLARAGAKWLGVTDVVEGAVVRKALSAQGIAPEQQPEILVMSGLLYEDADAIIRHNLTAVVWEIRQMEWLIAASLRTGARTPIPIHLEVDTGMARQGVVPGDDLKVLLHWLKAQPALRLAGVMTHFASTEVAESPQTLRQRLLFEQAVQEVSEAGLRPAWIHAGNSSTVDNQDTEENLAWLRELAAAMDACSMVRTGIALYGYCLPIGTAGASPNSAADSDEAHCVRPKLCPVGVWKTRVIGLREVHPGDTIGYNGTFSAERPMRLALLPVGYADGLRRELSASNTRPGGWAVIRGRRVPIVGRVSMNLTIVDLTGDGDEIADVDIGDEVVVLGDGITADDHARLASTISYEIVCGLRAESRLVP